MNQIPPSYSHTDDTNGRRRFLRTTAAGTLFLAVGSVSGFAAGTSSHVPPLRFFDPHEFEIFCAVADRIIGHRNNDAPSLDVIAQRADAFLATEHPEIQEQFHLLLSLFNSPWIAFLFDLRWSSFLSMTPDAKDAYLNDWMQSPLPFRRTAFQGLKRLSLSVYYTHPGSWEKIGFDAEYSTADNRS